MAASRQRAARGKDYGFGIALVTLNSLAVWVRPP